MKLAEKVINLYEMSNYRPKTTGLEVVIWAETKTNKAKHGPRIKVSQVVGDKINDKDLFTITISSKPVIIGTPKLKQKIVNSVVQFIIDNEKLLLQLWNGEVDSFEFGQKLSKSRS